MAEEKVTPELQEEEVAEATPKKKKKSYWCNTEVLRREQMFLSLQV